MKTFKKYPVSMKRQAGMTAIELMVVLAVIALLAFGAIGAKTYIDKTKISNARTQVMERIFTGIVDYSSTRGGSSAGITSANCASTGANANSVYGSAWSCTYVAASKTVTVTYPVNDDDAGAALVASMTTANYPILAANATYSTSTGNATISFDNP